MSTHDTQMIDRFINAIHKEENLDKYLLALQVIKEGIVYDKTQMLLFDSIDFDKIIEKMLLYPKILIMTLYHKDTFEFLLDHWTFDGTEAIEIIKQQRYEYLDRVPLNMIVDGKTPLDHFPDLRQHTNLFVARAKTIRMLGSKTVDQFVEEHNMDYSVLFQVSDDLDIDMDKHYTQIRDASYTDSLIFIRNYYDLHFREKANKDTSFMQQFLFMLKQSIAWNRGMLEDYLKHKEKYKLYHLAKILECMHQHVDSYKKQLSILELEFL